MVDKKHLIERGYFPKELPPPFNTSKLAQNIDGVMSSWDTIFEQNTDQNNPHFVLANTGLTPKQQIKNFKAKHGASTTINFSISKGNLRRFLGIPNPNQYIYLVKEIADNWNQFEVVFNLSKYSQSQPIPTTDLTNPTKRSISTRSENVNDFRDHKITTSLHKSIEIFVDISKFYPTIYTHSITWAFLGKEKAKQYWKQKEILDNLISNGDNDAILYKLADKIDTYIRNCQDRQSIGIPIGPDTSHIIAELIACRIDIMLKESCNPIDLRGCRYFDDYYLYVSTRDEAEKVLKILQKILTDFQLEVNESKVAIKEFPFSFEDEFVLVLNQFQFGEINSINNVIHYFSLVWGLVDKNPQKSHSIFRYALKTFEFRSIKITQTNWEIFENLLLKSALIEPSILDVVTRILLTYQNYFNAETRIKLKKVIEMVIENHSQLKNSFEVAWALWLAKTFQIEIEYSIVNSVINMKDSISLLILLDILQDRNLIAQYSNLFIVLEQDLTEDVFNSDLWLFAYEGIKKGWISSSNPNLISDNHFFKILQDLDIDFYNRENQVQHFAEQLESTQEVQSSLNEFSIY